MCDWFIVDRHGNIVDVQRGGSHMPPIISDSQLFATRTPRWDKVEQFRERKNIRRYA